MIFEEFLETQNKIYNQFRKRKVERLEISGANPSGKVASPIDSVSIYFRHSPKISKRVADFSKRISQQGVPTLKYQEGNIHTTILWDSKLDIEKNYLLEQLSETVEGLREDLENPLINYTGWLINESSLIAEGYPNEEAFEIMYKIHEEAGKRGMNFRFPWGGHITLSKFLKKGNFSGISKILKMVEEEPQIGKSKIDSIEVGEVFLNPETLDLRHSSYYERRT